MYDLENVLVYSYSGYSGYLGYLYIQFNMSGRLDRYLLWKAPHSFNGTMIPSADNRFSLDFFHVNRNSFSRMPLPYISTFVGFYALKICNKLKLNCLLKLLKIPI